MASHYEVITITLAPGTSQDINVTGEFVSCVKSTEGDFLLSVDSGKPSYFAEGMTFRCPPGESFRQLNVTNNDPIANGQFFLAYGYGEVIDLRSAPRAPGTFGTFVDVSLVVGLNNLNPNAGRVQTHIFKNLITNPREIRIGSGVANQGYPLDPGETFQVRTSASIFVFNPHTAPVPLSYSIMFG